MDTPVIANRTRIDRSTFFILLFCFLNIRELYYEVFLGVLFSLYRISGVPSFLVCTGAGLAASLLALYLISGVPSFLWGPAVGVVACLAEAVVVGWVAADALVVLALAGVLGVVCAKLMPVNVKNRLAIRRSFFILGSFLIDKQRNSM